MPRITVYVPDGLVDRMRELSPEANMSAIFQGAVEGEIHRMESEKELSALIREHVDLPAVRAKLRLGREANYERGYKGALGFAGTLQYDDWMILKGSDWHTNRLWRVLAEYGAFDEEDMKNADWLQGFAAGLRDVWDTVHAEDEEEDDS